MKKIIANMTAVLTLMSISAAVSAAAECSTPAEIYVPSLSAKAGDEVDVPLELRGDFGIAALAVSVDYDRDALELTGAEECGLFTDAAFVCGGDIKAIPYKLAWENGLARENYTDTGEFAILHFKVRENAPTGIAEITVSLDKGSTFNVDLVDVPFTCINGGIDISSDDTADMPEKAADKQEADIEEAEVDTDIPEAPGYEENENDPAKAGIESENINSPETDIPEPVQDAPEKENSTAPAKLKAGENDKEIENTEASQKNENGKMHVIIIALAAAAALVCGTVIIAKK